MMTFSRVWELVTHESVMKNTIAEKMLSLESKDDGSWVKTSINASFKKKKRIYPLPFI